MQNQKQLSSPGWLLTRSLKMPEAPQPTTLSASPGRAGGCCGNVILRIAPACQELTDPFFILPEIRLFIWAREREANGRWNTGGTVTHLLWHWFWSVCLVQFGLERSEHLTYGGDRCIRDSVGEKHLRRALLCPSNDAWLTFKIHLWNILASSALVTHELLMA